MRIHHHRLSGSTLSLDVDPAAASVDELRAKLLTRLVHEEPEVEARMSDALVANAYAPDDEMMISTISGRELLDGRQLELYNLHNESVLHYLRRPKYYPPPQEAGPSGVKRRWSLRMSTTEDLDRLEERANAQLRLASELRTGKIDGAGGGSSCCALL